MRITKPKNKPPNSDHPRPLIISASRATDIPAFHSRWLMERLREGFVDKLNPYNQKPMRIEFSRAKAIIFWTKNPAPILTCLPEIIERGLTPLFLFTLNNYEDTGWEPKMPPLAERLECFIRLAEYLPFGSLVWRLDPIALGKKLSADELAARAEAIHKQIGPYIEKLIFSFVDLYPKVQRRLTRLGQDLREPDADEKDLILKKLIKLKHRSPSSLRLCSCAEGLPGNFSDIEPGSCIDAALLTKLCPDLTGDPELFLPAPSRGLFSRAETVPLKDRGQRPRCLCAPSRDIGAYNTCSHDCIYCYANR